MQSFIEHVGAEGWASLAAIFAALWLLSELQRAHEARTHARELSDGFDRRAQVGVDWARPGADRAARWPLDG